MSPEAVSPQDVFRRCRVSVPCWRWWLRHRHSNDDFLDAILQPVLGLYHDNSLLEVRSGSAACRRWGSSSYCKDQAMVRRMLMLALPKPRLRHDATGVPPKPIRHIILVGRHPHPRSDFYVAACLKVSGMLLSNSRYKRQDLSDLVRMSLCHSLQVCFHVW